MQYIWILIHRLYQIINTPQKLYFSQNMISGRVSCVFIVFARGEKIVAKGEKKIAAKYDFVLCQPLYLS